MSLILGYANKNNAIIMSDGRAGENGCVSETYNKTLKINDNIIIGFAGIAERIEIFTDHFINEMGADQNKYFVNDFFEMIQFLMDDEDTHQYLLSSFIIMGRDDALRMHSAIIGNCTGYKLEDNTVTNARYSAIGGTIDGQVINQIYSSLIGNMDIPIKDAMRNTILQVSNLDSSVNTNTFSVTI